MRRLQIHRELAPDEIHVVQGLLAVAERVDGHRPLSDHLWLDLAHGGRPGFVGIVAWEPGHERPVAYAQVSAGHGGFALELVVHPHHRHEMATLGRELLDAALDEVRRSGGGRVHWWVVQPTAVHDQLARDAGLCAGRTLHQMRRALPVGEVAELPTRPFVPGKDEAAWLEVNNRAFRDHPEQGGWDLETLSVREQEPWFDPAGFLLHEREGRLAGFCWTKLHLDADPPMGEIYVIAVDPDFQGLGLGRALTLAGLDWIHQRGVKVGMLYVDADNAAAVALYRHLGFRVHRVDRAYTGEVAAGHDAPSGADGTRLGPLSSAGDDEGCVA